MEQLNEAGGVYAVMNELSKKNLLNLDCITVTGKTVGENIANVVNKDPEVIRSIDNPYSQTGGIAVLKGNLAPDSGFSAIYTTIIPFLIISYLIIFYLQVKSPACQLSQI